MFVVLIQRREPKTLTDRIPEKLDQQDPFAMLRQMTFFFLSAVVLAATAAQVCADAPRTLKIGDPAPNWKFVPGTDGQLHSLQDYNDAQIVVVAFLCNKCPCVKGYEERFKRLVTAYGSRVRFVGINSSTGDVETMDIMKQRVASGGLNFDYLRDESQTVARSFGATSTPHIFILDKDRRVAYTGAFDDNRDAKQVTQHYALNALNSLLKGEAVSLRQTQQFGCAITYR